MKKYKISLNVSQEINAETEKKALDIFWNDFNYNQTEEENANIKEIK